MKDIVEKAIQGDRSAIELLYKTYYTPVYRYILLRVGKKEDAEDIVQNIFIKFIDALKRYEIRESKGEVTLLPYLYTMSRNAIIDFKKKSREVIVDDEVLNTYATDLDPQDSLFEKKEWSVWLYKALAELSCGEREVLEFRFLSELSNEEISRILHKNLDAIRQLQSRGIKRLRDILKRDEVNFDKKTRST